jgi:hypothetical protein
VIRDELLEHWAAEAAQSERDSYEGRRIIGLRSVEAYAGVEKAGSLRFVAIRIDSAQRRSLADRYPRSSKGIAVESVEGGGGKVTFFLREQAGAPEGVFPAVMEDVLGASAVAPQDRALRASFERFASWQTALSREAGAMSAQEVRGIIGELVIARDVLVPCLGPARLVQVWKAPIGDHVHDFMGQNWELEVKTTLVPGTTFHISAEGQLEPEIGNRMFLGAVEMEPSSDGISMRELVEQILSSVEASGPTREDLRNAIVGRGALAHSLDDEASRRYRIRATNVFEVPDSFPLIRRKTLPAGVSALRYEVSYAACSGFRTGEAVLSETLKGLERQT